MGFVQNEKQEFVVVNFNIDKVYDAVIKATKSIAKFKITNENKLMHSLTINVSMSLFSWGETMTVTLNSVDENKTEVRFSSASKLSSKVAYNVKNQKNIDELMNAVSKILQ